MAISQWNPWLTTGSGKTILQSFLTESLNLKVVDETNDLDSPVMLPDFFFFKSVSSYSIFWKTEPSFYSFNLFIGKNQKDFSQRLTRYLKNRARKCQPTQAVVPCNFWTSLLVRIKAIACAVYVLPPGISIFLPCPVPLRQEWSLLPKDKRAKRLWGQVLYEHIQQQPFIKPLLPEAFRWIPGDKGELAQTSHMKGLAVLPCLSSDICFYLCFTLKKWRENAPGTDQWLWFSSPPVAPYSPGSQKPVKIHNKDALYCRMPNSPRTLHTWSTENPGH